MRVGVAYEEGTRIGVHARGHGGLPVSPLRHETKSQLRRSARLQTEYFLFRFLFLVSLTTFLSSVVLSRQRTSDCGGN